jgi:hypothetical protein
MTPPSEPSECYPWYKYVPKTKQLYHLDKGLPAQKVIFFYRGKKYFAFYVVHEHYYTLYGLNFPFEMLVARLPGWDEDDVHKDALELIEHELKMWLDGVCFEHEWRPVKRKKKGQTCCSLAITNRRRNRRK